MNARLNTTRQQKIVFTVIGCIVIILILTASAALFLQTDPGTKQKITVALSPSVSSYRNLIDHLRNTQRIEESDGYLRQALRKYPDNIDFIYLLGNSLRQDPKTHREAETVLKHGIEKNPGSPKLAILYEQLGKLAVTQNNIDQAETYFNKSIVIQPHDNHPEGAFFQLVKLLFAAKRSQEAITLLDHRAQLYPTEEYFIERASILLKNDSKEAAESALRAGILHYPDSTRIRNALAKLYYTDDITDSLEDPVK